MANLQGGTAVVTGAAGGLGRALARELRRRGFRLALVDRHGDALADVVDETGDAISRHAVDLADPGATALLAAELRRCHATVDVLVCAAGVSVASPVETLLPDDLRWQLDHGFFASAWPIQALLPLLRARPRAAIAIVGSAVAALPVPTKAAYAAAKAALRAFGEALASELRGSGVTLTELVPGPLATAIAARGRADAATRAAAEDQLLRRRGMPPERVARAAITAVLAGRSRAFLDVRARIADLAARTLPVAARRALAQRMGRRLTFLQPTPMARDDGPR